MKQVNFLLILVITLATGSCAYKPTTDSYAQDAENHILRVNRHGYLINSDFATYPFFRRNSQTPKPIKDANAQIDSMLTEAVLLACNKANSPCDEVTSINDITEDVINKINELKILVYVHGGLNTYANTDERMESQLSQITQEQSDWHYPIYISWPSNVPGTIQEHYFEVREGRDTSTWAGILSSPFVLFEDIFTAIGRAPANVYYQFTNDKDRFASGWNNDFLSSVWKEADYQYTQHFFDNPGEFESNKYYVNEIENIKINRSTYQNTGFVNGVKSGALVVVTPVRYVAGIVWNGTLAGDSWDMMKRRARAIAYPTGEFNKSVRDSNRVGQGVGRLFSRLFELEKQHPTLDIKLTLVGHSMGTIVLNNMLTRYQTDFEKSQSLDTIVYMAAAANTIETLSIVPDILRNNPNNIGFYNLTLNRVAEVAETYFAGLAPSGSLLVSIDKYHDAPEHHLLRTFGSEVNIQSSLTTIRNAFSNMDDPVTLKAFNKVQDQLPFKHGHFGDLKFWKCETWQISTNDVEQRCH
ncbi:hypothetical protein HII17_10950 [Thalassotalea sp. M1531]|uniref:Alpha/beta hydrolase n=1 Tax=Thalassotalea algicola TaxID=2716224 RepID=A0A7Y0Q7N3_9GAMM|nr:hypothetical protein [Thalassotalea algicola]NMP32087.1 hypothetical protein [Thalassotalea algicola]